MHFAPQYGKTKVEYSNVDHGSVLFRFRVGDNIFCTLKVKGSKLTEQDKNFYMGKV